MKNHQTIRNEGYTGQTISVENWSDIIDAVVRDNLVFYKENGKDHGDLVMCEEAILTKFKDLLYIYLLQEHHKLTSVVNDIYLETTKDDGGSFAIVHNFLQMKYPKLLNEINNPYN